LDELKVKLRVLGAGESSHTTLLVHGTLARQEQWWQPGGDFYTYLSGLLPSLPRTPRWDAPYGLNDRFSWSGGYSSGARSIAANDLLQWASNHGSQKIDLVAHSHGGNVAMLATNSGLTVGELVLLSCPALLATYLPDFSRIHGKIVSVRVHMDMVLILDSYVTGATHKFFHPRIEEHTLALWFDHSKIHSPDVWKNVKYNIPQML
jgi:pimeloyl-ACP methyl ester carboxylesterase